MLGMGSTYGATGLSTYAPKPRRSLLVTFFISLAETRLDREKLKLNIFTVRDSKEIVSVIQSRALIHYWLAPSRNSCSFNQPQKKAKLIKLLQKGRSQKMFRFGFESVVFCLQAVHATVLLVIRH